MTRSAILVALALAQTHVALAAGDKDSDSSGVSPATSAMLPGTAALLDTSEMANEASDLKKTLEKEFKIIADMVAKNSGQAVTIGFSNADTSVGVAAAARRSSTVRPTTSWIVRGGESRGLRGRELDRPRSRGLVDRPRSPGLADRRGPSTASSEATPQVAAGTTEKGGKETVGADYKLPGGSLTKPLTAASIMHLVDKGTLKLDQYASPLIDSYRAARDDTFTPRRRRDPP